MMRFPIFHLHKYYDKKQIFNAFFVGVIYHIIGLAGLGILLANILFLYLPFLVYFLTTTFILGSFILARGNHHINQTLKNYTYLATFPYERMYKQNTLFDTVILFVVLTIIYLLFH
ncbi:MAG: hypothetical protein K9L26_02190 [Candidatus Izimaplasma sp.]|nr:hypothetical protein [Candidatus Izimaplasma bacterium]